MRTLDAWVKLSEHGDQAAIATLEGALADVADLPPSREIVQAQAEIGRALMVAGRSAEALIWVDRAIENPDLLSPAEIVEAIVTKGTVLLQVGRTAESEVVLRGAIVVADRSGNALAAMRARNNLSGMVESISLEAANDMAKEVYEIAQRFGMMTWVLQSVAVGQRVSFELGRWDEWMDEGAAELPEGGADFYRIWYEANQRDRLAYQGGAKEAEVALKRSIEEQTVRESAQAQAGLSAQLSEILMAQQRWTDAVEAARGGWNHSDMARYATINAVFAATAAGDRDLIEEARQAYDRAVEGPELPLPMAYSHVIAALGALLDERWEAGRASYLQAKRLLEQVSNQLMLARFQLAVGHLAANHFLEAAEAAREAEAFFHERGADAYVEGYRARAARAKTAATTRTPKGAKQAGSPVS